MSNLSKPFSSPAQVRAPLGARVLEIDWEDGRTSRFQHSLLRGFCPCAHCQGHQGPIRFVKEIGDLASSERASNDKRLELESLEEVGNYALRLDWADGHNTGLYSYSFLHELAALDAMDEDTASQIVFSR